MDCIKQQFKSAEGLVSVLNPESEKNNMTFLLFNINSSAAFIEVIFAQ